MIEAHNLTKRFGDFTAVAGLDLDVAEGEILALLGHNGAGKTTTVRMLCSLLAPSAGTARIAGYDTVTEAETVRSLIGLLTELPGLYNRMRAPEYLDFFGAVQGMAPDVRRARADAMLQQFDLGYARDRRLGEYSKGMRQKVALIRTLLHDPLVVFLDEPTSAMDPQSAKVVRDSIADLRGSRRTVVLCSHNLAEAESLADRIAIIKRGRILARGTAEELKRSLLGPPLYDLCLTGPVASYLGLLDFGPDADFAVLDQGADWLRYRTATPAAINPVLLARLTAAGANVLTLAEVPRSLEAVYLTLMADAEQEKPGERDG
jgi:ABC-2 type transport system ATP-binding protein